MTNLQKLAEVSHLVSKARLAAYFVAEQGIVAEDLPLKIGEREGWRRLTDGRRGLVIRHPPGLGPIATIDLVVDHEEQEAPVLAARVIHDWLAPYLWEHPEDEHREYEPI